MGTSVNQSSPRSGPGAVNWRAAAAGYVNDEVSLDRVIQEIWRAARVQEASWVQLLQTEGVAVCYDAAQSAETPELAVAQASQAIVEGKLSSLATDVAKRALVQGFLRGGPRDRAFADCLFQEVTGYLVSRDLPGYVGDSFRNHTVTAAIAFKDHLRALASEKVAGAVQERGVPAAGNREAWADFVALVVDRLSS